MPTAQADHNDHHGDEEDQLAVLADHRDRRHRDDDGDDRQTEGQHGGHYSAKEQQQYDQRHRDAEPLALLKIVRRQLVVLECHAGVTADQHTKVVRCVSLLHPVDHVLDIGRSFLGRAGQRVVHEYGLAVGRYQERKQPRQLIRCDERPGIDCLVVVEQRLAA